MDKFHLILLVDAFHFCSTAPAPSCTLTNPCKNGGTCAGNEEGFTCACDKLHTGPTCEEGEILPEKEKCT